MSSGEPTAAVTTAVGKDSAELREKCAQCADTQADSAEVLVAYMAKRVPYLISRNVTGWGALAYGPLGEQRECPGRAYTSIVVRPSEQNNSAIGGQRNGR